MVTLQKLAADLNVGKMDEIVGGYYHQGDVQIIEMEERFGWTITTENGTSGETGWTFTTDEAIKVSGFDPETGQMELGYHN